MDDFIEWTLEKIENLSMIGALRFINFAWYNKFFNVQYIFEDKEKIDIDDRNLTYFGSRNKEAMVYYLRSCRIQNRDLIRHLDKSPRLIDGKIVDIDLPPSHFLLNVSMSCALDSLLSIMFFVQGGYFMAKIADSVSISDRKLPVWLQDKKEQLERASDLVKNDLFFLFNRSSWKNQNIKKIQQNVAMFIEDDCSNIKSVIGIWEILCTFFNTLAFDLQTKRGKEIGNKPVETFAISITDNLFPPDLENLPDHLVYFNDNIVDPVDFSDYGYSKLKGYDLVGVVNHIGQHYTSKIKVDDRWYTYDDLNGHIIPYDSSLLEQTKKERVVMLFYCKKIVG